MTKQNEDSSFKSIAMPVIWGIVTATAATLIIVCAAAFLISAVGKGIGAAVYIAPAALTIGGFLGGLIAAKKAKKNGLLNGAAVGALLFLVIAVLSLALTDTDISYIFWIRFGICVLSSALGGIFGVNSSKKPY